MDPERRRRLSRAIWRGRLRKWLPAVLLIGAFVGAMALVGGEPRRTLPREVAIIANHRALHSDEGVRRLWMVERGDGTLLEAPHRRDLTLVPGDRVCIVQMVGRLTGRITTRIMAKGGC